MSLNGALQIGKTALNVSQTAMQVAGNNLANAATEGYSRRVVQLGPIRDEATGRGQYVGRGVELISIRRAVDTALQSRLRDAISEESAARTDQRYLGQVETIQNELTDNDVSSLMSAFFNAWSELANAPTDDAVRAVVIQQGATLADRIADLRSDYDVLRSEIDDQAEASVTQINDLLGRIAEVNVQLAELEVETGEAAALRDQRDQWIDTLAEQVDVTVVEQPSGSADILINSTPVVLGSVNRGVEVRRESVDGEIQISLRVAADGTEIQANSGTLGSLVRQRDETVTPAIDALNQLASELIHAVNLVHASGQGESGFTSVTGSVQIGDTTANLNAGDADVPYDVANGSFYIHVTHSDTGQREAFRIDVDGDAMSLDDLMAEINTVVGVPNVTASTDVEDRFVLDADAGYEISFSEDTSGVLAALGVNTFFTGSTAADIAVSSTVEGSPGRLAVASGHVPGSNETALAIANLQDEGRTALGGSSLRQYWQNEVNQLAVRVGAARSAAESAGVVRESLYAQHQSVSGVSVDEETVNLLSFQRQFQAAARYIQTIDETLQILLSLG